MQDHALLAVFPCPWCLGAAKYKSPKTLSKGISADRHAAGYRIRDSLESGARVVAGSGAKPRNTELR